MKALLRLFLIGIIVFFSVVGIAKVLEKKQTLKETTASSEPLKISKGGTASIPLKVADGFVVHVFATNLGAPRDLVFSPGGTLLVSNPSGDEVIALVDKDKDGVADANKIVLTGEDHAHGLAFYNNKLFVAAVDKVVRYNWDEKNLQANLDKVLFALPANNNHNNRTIVFDAKGIMYVSVGSTCNVCTEDSHLSATILTSNSDGDNPQVYAKGLRNAPFMAFNPTNNELWATEMGRDNLGDNIPPDEIDVVVNPSTSSGPSDYGWPNCYGNKIHDTNFDTSKTDPCGSTLPPLYEIPAHSAPLGLAFIQSSQFEESQQNDLLVSYHGSWNRTTPIGYKVVHLTVVNNKVVGAQDFLTGFLPKDASTGTDALGRPVDLIFDKTGNLYVSDDKSGKIYIIQKDN